MRYPQLSYSQIIEVLESREKLFNNKGGPPDFQTYETWADIECLKWWPYHEEANNILLGGHPEDLTIQEEFFQELSQQIKRSIENGH